MLDISSRLAASVEVFYGIRGTAACDMPLPEAARRIADAGFGVEVLSAQAWDDRSLPTDETIEQLADVCRASKFMTTHARINTWAPEVLRQEIRIAARIGVHQMVVHPYVLGFDVEDCSPSADEVRGLCKFALDSGVRLVLDAMTPAPGLDGHRIVLMPCANPDGYAAKTRQNANGVDLNRNFPDKTYGTGKKSGKYDGGKIAASEPETRAIMDTVNLFKPSLIVSLHDPLACVNYNGSCIRIAKRISKATGLPVVGDIGYPCPGSMGNYYGFDKRLPVITLELPEENVDVAAYAGTLLNVLGLTDH